MTKYTYCIDEPHKPNRFFDGEMEGSSELDNYEKKRILCKIVSHWSTSPGNAWWPDDPTSIYVYLNDKLLFSGRGWSEEELVPYCELLDLKEQQ